MAARKHRVAEQRTGRSGTRNASAGTEKTTDAASRVGDPGRQSGDFVDRAVALLRPLLRYAGAELRMHEALGDLVPGALDPEDIVDAALLDGMRHAADAPADGFYAWLRHFVRRAIARELSTAERQRRAISLDDTIGGEGGEDIWLPPRLIDVLPDPASPIPEQAAETAELQQALTGILRQLPAEWRELFVLHIVEGLPLEEVAQLEGLSLAEVERRIERAGKRLRGLLAEEYQQLDAPPDEMLFTALAGALPAVEHVARLRGRLRSENRTSAMEDHRAPDA